MKNKVIIKVKKKLYNVIALPVLKKLFRILPISRNKIVFDNFCGKGYGGNPKYIAEAILDSKVKDIDLIWLVDNFMSVDKNLFLFIFCRSFNTFLCVILLIFCRLNSHGEKFVIAHHL